MNDFEDIFNQCGFPSVEVDNLSDINVMSEITPIDLDGIEQDADTDANEIVGRLANYFFDSEYLEQHPYIPTKIKTVTDVVRRTVKMLKTNEAAQDKLIKGISLDPTKASLFAALTSLQHAAGSLQRQLTEHISELESIFQKIEDDTERTFAVKDKLDDDGVKTVRGSKEFILRLKGELK